MTSKHVTTVQAGVCGEKKALLIIKCVSLTPCCDCV